MSPEEIQGIFFVECEESLASAEQGLAACKAGTQDSDTVNAIFRAVHSIKGGAGAFGFEALQAFTHTFETLLSDVRENLVPITPTLIDLLLRALDVLSDHVTAARDGGSPPEDASLIREMEGAMANAQGANAQRANAPVAPEAATHAVTFDEDDMTSDLDLDDLLNDLAGGAPAQDGPSGWKVHLRPHAGAMRNGGEPLLLLRELAALGAVACECDLTSIPALDDFDPHQGYLGWTYLVPNDVSEASVRDIFDFVGDDCPIAIGPEATIPPIQFEPSAAMPAPAPSAPKAVAPAPVAVQAPVAASAAPAPAPAAAPPVAPEAAAASGSASPAAPAPGQSIRIDLVKLDKLIDTVGELVIAQAMLAQRLQNENVQSVEELTLLESLTRDIQESAMSIRAQPIGSVFSRVPRILRELSASTGKHVNLQVFGETTELDKTVIERLGEPLTHLIRNAVDHGIESPEDRLAKGKSPEGTLTLSAEHRSGRILIKIADDGAGINRARVFAKAVEKGIVAPDAVMSKEEIEQLIFAAGFSTAATITNVSGRGVGMDVVRQNVKDLGGRISIESEEGKGTTFILTLPLTLAISDGMIVKVGDQTLVVPLTHVVESLRPEPKDVQGLGSSRQMLNVRGRFIPVVSVAEAVGAYDAVDNPSQGVLIVVDTESAGQAALLVDNIWDQRQFVIKSLDTHYRNVDGVAGATILGDGRVALILNVDTLVQGAVSAGFGLEAA
ncbi:chemotaxis protein CheA [Novosphingobium sp. KACC 22771]|uniref:chemotaxis protein CheA n=1 Tax=Novosphingobium sp. KACC 22771 TaxID=3025670 RepID=UPI002366D602|nr:chemotaxis protein CheA [Novosphingobium sp. KACC 22771]WDF73243.1 chemotaxis protein CheA [Novosphingobium sp. KACC 22771]